MKNRLAYSAILATISFGAAFTGRAEASSVDQYLCDAGDMGIMCSGEGAKLDGLYQACE